LAASLVKIEQSSKFVYDFFIVYICKMKKRINISIDSLLHEKAHAWSRLNRTTFSNLLELLLRDLIDNSESRGATKQLVCEPVANYTTSDNIFVEPLIAKIRQLPAYQQQQLDVYTDFLLSRTETNPRKRLPPGMLQGAISMSNDFDEPLSDFHDYM
jgi:hypothetical protein